MAMAVRRCDMERIAQCSMTRASPNQHNNDATYNHFAGQFEGHRDAATLYCTHRPMEEVWGFHKSH